MALNAQEEYDVVDVDMDAVAEEDEQTTFNPARCCEDAFPGCRTHGIIPTQSSFTSAEGPFLPALLDQLRAIGNNATFYRPALRRRGALPVIRRVVYAAAV
jgi:hypothetical protein